MVNYSFSWSGAAPFQDGVVPVDPLDRGIVAHRSGDLAQARTRYLEAMKARPNRALAAYDLGVAYIETGMGMASLPFLLRAMLLQPDSGIFGEALLFARLRSGRLSAAEALLGDLQLRNLGIETDRWRQWLRQCKAGVDPATLEMPAPRFVDPRTLAECPDRPLALRTETAIHATLGAAFARALEDHRCGRMDKLVDELEPIIGEHPDWGEGHHLYGLGLLSLGRLDRSIASLQRASELLPGRAELWDHLGIALCRLDDHAAVSNAYEHSLALNPLRPESWSNAADGAISREQYSEGYQYAFVAVTIKPDEASSVFNLGRAAKGIGDYALARRAFDRLLQASPEHAAATQELGVLCLEEGDHVAAAEHFNRVLAIDLDNQGVQSSLIFLNNYLGSESQARIHDRACRYASLLERGVATRTSWSNTPDPFRKLRVGIVSGDLRAHPVGYFFCSVAEALARSEGLDLFAYPTTRQTDALTTRIRASCSRWTPIAGCSDDEASALIAADGIDILIDLSGHTAKHRLGVFARKPSPVQATWLGYFGTTGLSQVDYLVAGPWDVPAEEEAEFSERIWRLPETRLCFSRPEGQVAVAPLPAARIGHVTFGCFNNLRKLNDRVVALWSQLVSSVSGSLLFLKAQQLESAQVRAAVTERFRGAGLDPARLILEGRSPFHEYLAAYGRVDIALDPFPYTGGTTSVQALWMGVPVLTLAGDRLLARQGESMLRALSMDDWVAASESDYIDKATQHAAGIERLGTLRAGLRGRLESSPLMDAPRFAGDLEVALRGMWTRWCESQNGASHAAAASDAGKVADR